MSESQRLTASAVSAVAMPIYQYIWESQGKSRNWLGRDQGAREVLFISKKYEEGYRYQHGIAKLFGVPEQIPLQAVYTNIKLFDYTTICTLRSIVALEEFDFQAEKPCQEQQDGLEVANKKQYLMVLGGPGSGKSTFLRWVGLEALKTKKKAYQHECIPVFIQLKGLAAGDINIKQKIVDEFNKYGFPEAEKFTNRALQEGKLLVLLDGIDDVPTKQMNEAIHHLETFVKRYDDNRFIASCRIATYRHNFASFTDMAIPDFADNQAETFVKLWFAEDPQTGKECWEKVSAFKELIKTRLVLSLVCLLYQSSRSFPIKLVALYEQALQIVLTASTESGINQEDFSQKFDAKTKKIMLSAIAHDAFQEDLLFLREDEIADKIEKHRPEALGQEKFINGIDILKGIKSQHGVLIERGEGIYSFFHLTIQEYLVAQYIHTHHQVEKLVAEHLNDKRWREVFLFIAGLEGDKAVDLLLSMEDTVLKYINTPNLQALFNWCEEAIPGESDNFNHQVSNRASALAVAIAIAGGNAKTEAATIAIDNAYAIANTIASAIDHSSAVVIANVSDYIKTNTNIIIKAINSAIANLNVNAYAFKRANTAAIDTSIIYVQELEQLKIFQNVDFASFKTRLQALKTAIPGEQYSMEVRREFVQGITQSWLDTLNLTPEMVNLSEEEAKALENYFYVNYLMLQCQQAVQISSQTWQAIEEQMFSVGDDSSVT